MTNSDDFKKFWLEDTERGLENTRKNSKPYRIRILGKTLVIHPGVFSPKYFTDTHFFAEVIPKIVGRGSFLEIGVGTGLVSLYVARNGATKVVGTDIDPRALENTKENFERHGLHITPYKGSVFEPVSKTEKFDYIFWNHPFNSVDYELDDMLLNSVFDTNFRNLERFFAGAHSFLTPDGTLILGTGELADQEAVSRLAKKHNWEQIQVERRNSKHRVGGGKTMELYVRQYRHRKL